MQTLKPILLLEDDDLDAMILARALRTLNVRNEIIRAEDGEKGLSYLLNDNSVRPYLNLTRFKYAENEWPGVSEEGKERS